MKPPSHWMTTARPILRYYWWALPVVSILYVVASLLEGLGLTLFIPLLQGVAASGAGPAGGVEGRLITVFSGIPEDMRLPSIAATIFFCIVLKNVVAFANSSLFSVISSRISHRLRVEVFSQMVAVSPRWLQGRPTGEIINTLVGETWRTGSAMMSLVGLIGNISMAAVLGVLLLLIAPDLTLIVGGAMCLVAIIIHWLVRQTRHLGEKAVTANEVMTESMWEGFSGISVIRAFGREEHEVGLFRERSEGVRRIFLRMELLNGLTGPIFEISSTLLILTVFTVLIMSNASSLPVLATFLMVLYRLQPQVKQIVSARVTLRSLSGSVANVMGFLDSSDKEYIWSGTHKPKALSRGVTFSNVSFSYQASGQPTLNDVSCFFEKGRTTALAGPSGAGKSTIIAQLCRALDPDEGEILVDDVPLTQLDLRAWRGKIGLVSQDVYLFSTSIRDNIAYGRPDATMEEILEAARLANADDFIRHLSDGYDTLVGERGMRLSGGQRQRIALARAILRDPEILVLDEATNALDSLSEGLIEDALRLHNRDRTVVVIAHRIATIQRADHVIVMDRGGIVEQGTPAGLLAKRGLYNRLYLAQQRRDDEADALFREALEPG
jgi:subfamily B ATP-binding cassette protein MsbA